MLFFRQLNTLEKIVVIIVNGHSNPTSMNLLLLFGGKELCRLVAMLPLSMHICGSSLAQKLENSRYKNDI